MQLGRPVAGFLQAAGQKVSASVPLRPQCQNLRRWFFDSPPQRCPEDVVAESYAAGQYFERGLMLRSPARFQETARRLVALAG